MNVKVYNSMAQCVYSQFEYKLQPGVHSIPIIINTPKQGIYLIKAQFGSVEKTMKVLIQQ